MNRILYKWSLGFFALTLVAVALTAAGCRNSQLGEKVSAVDAVTKAPAIDASTPDRSVRSYWALLDWRRSLNFASTNVFSQSDDYKSSLQLLAKLETKSMLGDLNQPSALESYSREILSANVETESRAAVVTQIKNTTPLPADAVLDAYDLKARANGSRIKYVLEKAADSWQISEAWEWDDSNASFRKIRPMSGKIYPVQVYGAW